MSHQPWLKSQVAYGQDLIHSAVEGARSAREHALANEPASDVLGRSARTALPLVALGAAVGVLALYSLNKKTTVRNQVVFGILGAVAGLGANMALSTRQLTREIVHGAVRNINRARDAHWLAKHPIDYA